jgi:hypothetical protein
MRWSTAGIAVFLAVCAGAAVYQLYSTHSPDEAEPNRAEVKHEFPPVPEPANQPQSSGDAAAEQAEAAKAKLSPPEPASEIKKRIAAETSRPQTNPGPRGTETEATKPFQATAPSELVPVKDTPIPDASPALLDRFTISPTLDYLLAKSTRSDNGQQAQLASKMSPGLAIRTEQNWTPEFQTFAGFAYQKYRFEDVPNISVKDGSGDSWFADLGAQMSHSQGFRYGARIAWTEDFIVANDSSGALQLIKLSRPSAGVFSKLYLWRSEKGYLSFVPSLAYAFQGKSGAYVGSAHMIYGAGLEMGKLATKWFSETGASLYFATSSFASTPGQSNSSSLRLQLNFSFDY